MLHSILQTSQYVSGQLSQAFLTSIMWPLGLLVIFLSKLFNDNFRPLTAVNELDLGLLKVLLMAAHSAFENLSHGYLFYLKTNPHILLYDNIRTYTYIHLLLKDYT